MNCLLESNSVAHDVCAFFLFLLHCMATLQMNNFNQIYGFNDGFQGTHKQRTGTIINGKRRCLSA